MSSSGASVSPSPYVARKVSSSPRWDATAFSRSPIVEFSPVSTNVIRHSSRSRESSSSFVLACAAIEHEVVEQRAVVRQEVLLDDLALVAEAEDELVVAPHRVVAHDVPEDRLAADLDHRLRDALGLLAHAHAEPAAEDHDLHDAGPAEIDMLHRSKGLHLEVVNRRLRTGSRTVAVGIGTISCAPHSCV